MWSYSICHRIRSAWCLCLPAVDSSCVIIKSVMYSNSIHRPLFYVTHVPLCSIFTFSHSNVRLPASFIPFLLDTTCNELILVALMVVYDNCVYVGCLRVPQRQATKAPLGMAWWKYCWNILNYKTLNLNCNYSGVHCRLNGYTFCVLLFRTMDSRQEFAHLYNFKLIFIVIL